MCFNVPCIYWKFRWDLVGHHRCTSPVYIIVQKFVSVVLFVVFLGLGINFFNNCRFINWPLHLVNCFIPRYLTTICLYVPIYQVFNFGFALLKVVVQLVVFIDRYMRKFFVYKNFDSISTDFTFLIISLKLFNSKEICGYLHKHNTTMSLWPVFIRQ